MAKLKLCRSLLLQSSAREALLIVEAAFIFVPRSRTRGSISLAAYLAGD